MRLGEKEVLASLTLMLLAFSAAAETRILEGRLGAFQATSWEAEIGLYLPFVLFALVSTYHFIDWARKHRRQAILLGIIIVGLASLLGIGTANAPRPLIDTMSLTLRPLTISQQETSGALVRQPYSFQDSLMQIQDVLSRSPYYSTGANVLVLLASFAALAFVLLRMRRERRATASPVHLPFLIVDRVADSPREAVIQCYRFACGTLQAMGLRIPESDTPFDICSRTKSVRPRIADSMWKLTTLFEEAKFSLHTITQTEAEEAHGYWETIRSNVSSN